TMAVSESLGTMLLCCVEAHVMGFQNTSFSTFRTASHTFTHCASREEGQSDTHWGPASPSFLHIDPGGRCQWNSSIGCILPRCHMQNGLWVVAHLTSALFVEIQAAYKALPLETT
uniref:Predicted gene 815 n=1 Tax=Mus spicilegus TaxID=10103 RepID=A0A8C6HW52_MUSSI